MKNLLCGIVFCVLLATANPVVSGEAPLALLTPVITTEQIVAVVNGQLLFQSDLLRNQTFFEIEMPTTVEKLVEYKLLLLEAKRFVLSPPQEDEVEESLNETRRKFPGEAAFLNALKETGWTVDGLRREILERLWVKKLIRDRISFFIFITDEEIGQYYQQHKNDFGQDVTLPSVKEPIRAILEKEKEAIKIKEYLLRIKSQANIEIHIR
jgi:hypothetical protein